MTTIKILQVAATGYIAIWALYLLLFPLVARLQKPRVRIVQRSPSEGWPTIAVFIPARNMSRVIAKCIFSLRICNYPIEKVDIYVIADHCSDDTALRARSAGATILTRNDGLQGKTYALAWALDELTKRGITPDMYVIVDAPVQVESNFLAALAERWRQGEDIITGHLTISLANQKWYARCLGLMLVHRNLQNWTRERIGLSALLEGTGMAYSRAYIQKFGWRLALPTVLRTSHPTEDWRHGVRAVEQGYRVAVAHDARAATPWRNSLTEATRQGIRWERGRIANAGTHALRLLMYGLQKQDLKKVFAALDAIQPPVAILGALSLVVAFSSIFTLDTALGRMGSFVPFILVGLYGLCVVWQGRYEGIGLTTGLWAPLYVAWRCVAFVLSWGFLDHFGSGRQGIAGSGSMPWQHPTGNATTGPSSPDSHASES